MRIPRQQGTAMIGKRLGKWTIEKEIGRGGMGAVYLARDESTSTLAALKVLAPELAPELGFLDRFQREIQALSALDHPHIVRFFEAGEENRHYYYAMEYVEGEDYEAILTRVRRLPWREVLDIALQLCPALKHAHDRGIVHRDLKPHNLLRGASGQVKLADFGIAKVFASRQLTRTGGIVGTADYLSPEQALGKPATKRSDLYSLGVVLYRMVTGWAPFSGGSTAELLHKHVYGQIEHPIKRMPELPHEFDELLCRLLEKDPDKRPADALVLQRELQHIQTKLARKALSTKIDKNKDHTLAENSGADDEVAGPGPATLMSHLMREELDRQRRAGPLSRFLNKPAILIPLFLLVVGFLVWRFWPQAPLDPEEMFAQGETLAHSNDAKERERAWPELLEPLVRNFPDHPRRAEAEALHRELEARRSLDRGLAKKRVRSEPQRFYEAGLRLLQEGDLEGAKRMWQAVATAYKSMPTAKVWTDLAEQGLKALESDAKVAGGQSQDLQKALDDIKASAQAGERDGARARLSALAQLYQSDPSALEQIHAAAAALK
jgi:serine/threonine protein kinase